MTRTATMTDGINSAGGNQTRPADGERTGPASKSGFAWAVAVKRSLMGEAISSKHLLIVTSQLSVMLAAGCDLCAGLDALSRQQAHPTLKKILSDLHTRVKQGQSFSSALAQHPEAFSDLYVHDGACRRIGRSLLRPDASRAAIDDPQQHPHRQFHPAAR